MYIGEPSLEKLEIFFRGYTYYELELNGQAGPFNGADAERIVVDSAEDIPSQPWGFQEFVQERYKVYSYYNAFGIILLNYSDDGEAFDKFFELLDEFLATQNEP